MRRNWVPLRTQAFVCSLEDRGGDVAGVRLAGELRAATAPDLARTLRRAEQDARLVVLDLRGLAVVDCRIGANVSTRAIVAQKGLGPVLDAILEACRRRPRR